MAVTVRKDRKGTAYEVGHRRAGYWESIFLTKDELIELAKELDRVEIYGV